MIETAINLIFGALNGLLAFCLSLIPDVGITADSVFSDLGLAEAPLTWAVRLVNYFTALDSIAAMLLATLSTWLIGSLVLKRTGRIQ